MTDRRAGSVTNSCQLSESTDWAFEVEDLPGELFFSLFRVGSDDGKALSMSGVGRSYFGIKGVQPCKAQQANTASLDALIRDISKEGMKDIKSLERCMECNMVCNTGFGPLRAGKDVDLAVVGFMPCDLRSNGFDMINP